MLYFQMVGYLLRVTLAPDHLSSYANNLDGIVAKSVAPDNVTRLKNP